MSAQNEVPPFDPKKKNQVFKVGKPVYINSKVTNLKLK